jgi:hypothetical protein
MLRKLRTWLNGKREYYSGVVLFAKYSSNMELYALLKKGPTEFTRKKLSEELMRLYMEENARQLTSGKDSAVRVRSLTLKTANNGENVIETAKRSDSKTTTITTGSYEPTPEIKDLYGLDGRIISGEPLIAPEDIEPPNEELWLACKKQADTLYKTIMNKRAELFALGRMDDMTDPNAPDRIEARRQLALDVVTGYEEVSLLYEKADYVKLHGKLPEVKPPEKEPDVEDLPDHLVKQTLDNLRKNYNKIKNREQTPERVALLQKHESNIKKLEERWHSLKLVK